MSDKLRSLSIKLTPEIFRLIEEIQNELSEKMKGEGLEHVNVTKATAISWAVKHYKEDSKEKI